MTGSEPEGRSGNPPEQARKWVVIVTAAVGLGTVALLVFAAQRGKLDPSVPPANEPADDGPSLKSPGAIGAAQDPVPAQSSIEPVPERPPPVTAATVSQPEPSGPARELVKSLIDIGLQRDAMTTESVEGWHKTVADLLQLGAEAVPALGEFLQKHEDVRFDPDPAINLLGEPTLRIAFLKLLSDLPGPQNLELQEQVLRTSADPDEIAVVARQLEMQEPGKYRQAIVESATATLAKARKGESPGHDDSPLVKILEQYGNSGVK